MASSEDFKKYIQAGKLTEALALAMSAAVKLQITTRVLGDEDMATGNDSQPGERIRTQINMVEGQITNEIGEQFTGKNPYKDLKQVHLAQVKEGAKTIQTNLKSLQKLFRLLVTMRQQNLLEITPIDVTATPELSPGLEQGILLPPMGGYEASGYEAIATTPEPVNAAAYDLGEAIPSPDSSIDYASSPEGTAVNLESSPELDSGSDSEKNEFNPLMGYGLLATAGVATVAAVAGITNAAQSGRSADHESLAELEPDHEPDHESDHEPEYQYHDDEDQGDATVIQLSTVAYSTSATYVPVAPLDDSVATASDPSQLEDIPDADAGLAPDFSHEDWDDFGENLPIETVSQMPHNAAELMAATLEATQPEPLSTEVIAIDEPLKLDEKLDEESLLEVASDEDLDLGNIDLSGTFGSSATGDEELLDEDWDGLELSPLNANELSSFADTQEAAWEDDWEDEPEEAIDLSRQMPPAPPIIMGYPIDHSGDIDIFDAADTDDQGWDDVEEEFKYVSSPTGGASIYNNNLDDDLLGNDLDDDLDDDFEIIGEIVDSSESDHNSFAAASDSMEDIFGDLDDNLLLSHDSSGSAIDDFANFDLDEEPPSSYSNPK